MLRKLLIVEDNDDAREMLATLLSMEGYDVITAEDGREGLDRAVVEQPDLIVTDINMPEMNGVEMIKELRSHESFNCVPIVVMTAYSERVAGMAIEAGADKAMFKPFDFDTLVGDLMNVCNSYRCRDSSRSNHAHSVG